MFWKAIRRNPLDPEAYALAALSLFSLKPLQFAITRRRRMIGNQIAATAGEAALAEQRATHTTASGAAAADGASLDKSATVTINARDTVTIAREPIHG